MNSYYIVPKKVHLENIHSFHPVLGSAYVDLNNNKILVSGHFLTHDGIEHWEFLPDVVTLPHPALEGHAPLSDNIVSQLQSLGIESGHTVLDVAEIVSRIHPLMKLRSF